jgi:hypothetical protein
MRESKFIDINFYSNASWKGRMQVLLELLMSQTVLRPDKIGNRLDKKKDLLELSLEQAPYLEGLWQEAIHISLFKHDPEYWLSPSAIS